MKRTELSTSRIERYRRRTFRLSTSRNIHTPAGARRFVDEAGFVFLWPIDGLDLPSLWGAVAGDRPVASEHDDPAHITWRWKDEGLGKGHWYYGKLLRGKATFVSHRFLPDFYALSPRLGDLDDFYQAYEDGGLIHEAMRVAEILLKRGPTDTIALREFSFMSSAGAKSRFERALTDLQRGLWILPVAVAEVGSWHYAFVYDLVDREFPGLVSQAAALSQESARVSVAGQYLDLVGVCHPDHLSRLFRWEPQMSRDTMLALGAAGKAAPYEDGRYASMQLLRHSS
jgi:hypothetical protein